MRFLLSGGQACILYGGTEFSRVASSPWLAEAVRQGEEALQQRLEEEERRIRADDRAYWQPLRKELERMRHRR